jgi:hypothetical protein
MFYHNNFIESVNFAHGYQHAYDPCHNYWNSTYKEGNFWDDYTGLDENWDGIGDEPYNISGGNNQDLYPIVVKEEDTKPPNVEIIKPKRALYIFNYKKMVLPFGITLILGLIEIQVNATDNQSGINCVEFYIDDELVFTDEEEPFTYMWKKETLFSSKHKQKIKVVAIDNYDNSNYEELNVIRFL